MKEKVYIDSTILSFYHDQRAELRSWIDATRLWWEYEMPNYECWISDAVFFGSSRNFMGRRKKIESTAVKKDSGSVVENVTEAPGIGLEGLDFGVEPFGDGVGDGEKREIEHPLQMLGEHLGNLFHFRQAGFHHPAFPFSEVGSRILKCVAFPKLPEVFLHGPSATGFQISALEFLELGRPAFGQVLGVEKEKMLRPLEAFVTFSLQDFLSTR